jgi:hypothetical protein
LTKRFSEADINYINSVQAFEVVFLRYIYSICLVLRPENYFPQDQLPFVLQDNKRIPSERGAGLGLGGSLLAAEEHQS